MPYDGNGVYNPLAPPKFPAVAGTVILANQYNDQILDMAAALTNCLTKDGQSKPSANINWNSKKITSLAPAVDPADAVRFDQIVKPGQGDTLNNNVFLKALTTGGGVVNLIGIDSSNRIVLGKDASGNFWARYNISTGLLELSTVGAISIVGSGLLTIQGSSTRNVGALNATGNIGAFQP